MDARKHILMNWLKLIDRVLPCDQQIEVILCPEFYFVVKTDIRQLFQRKKSAQIEITALGLSKTRPGYQNVGVSLFRHFKSLLQNHLPFLNPLKVWDTYA